VTVADETLTPQDAEHLRLLSLFHYIVAGLQALFASFPIIHFIVGAFMVLGPGLLGKGQDRFPAMAAGGFFMVFAAAWMIVGWTLVACVVIAGRSLARRQRYTFCLIVAGVEAAVCMPFGTILGVFTILVLMRPTVKAAFAAP
jgi:hypothetical protein